MKKLSAYEVWKKCKVEKISGDEMKSMLIENGIIIEKEKTGIGLIAIERLEQIEKHNRSIVDDVSLNGGEQLRLAAIRLLTDSFERDCMKPNGWDERLWCKMANKNYMQRLIISGALIAAEIDRIQAK